MCTPELVEDAEVYLPKSYAPEYLATRFEDTIESAAAVRWFSPVTKPRYVELLREKLLEDAVEFELILTRYVVEHLADNWSEFLEEALSTGRLTLLECEGDLPYGLLLADDPNVAGVEVYRDGTLQGVLLNDTEVAVSWAESTYETYRERATAVDESDLELTPRP